MRKMKVWAIAVAALSAATLGAACGDDGGSGTGGGDGTGSGSSGVCANVSCDAVPTFSDPALAWDLCVGCHSDNPTVREQNGVPPDSDYTTYEGVGFRGELVAERLNGVGAMMPPSGSPQPSDAQREAFTTWGCCGAPE
jgi:hypothetical protein